MKWMKRKDSINMSVFLKTSLCKSNNNVVTIATNEIKPTIYTNNWL